MSQLRGENHPKAKLSDATVDALRAEHETHGTSYDRLAIMFDCKLQTARSIAKYKTRTFHKGCGKVKTDEQLAYDRTIVHDYVRAHPGLNATQIKFGIIRMNAGAVNLALKHLCRNGEIVRTDFQRKISYAVSE